MYLSYGEGLFDATLPEFGEEFLQAYGASRDVATLDTRPYFLNQGRDDWVKGHYQGRENAVVAQAIEGQILPLLSGFPNTH